MALAQLAGTDEEIADSIQAIASKFFNNVQRLNTNFFTAVLLGNSGVFCANPTNAHSGLAAELLPCATSSHSCCGMGFYNRNKSDLTRSLNGFCMGCVYYQPDDEKFKPATASPVFALE